MTAVANEQTSTPVTTITRLDPKTEFPDIARIVTVASVEALRDARGDKPATANYSVEATRLLVEVFSGLGFSARAVPVDVAAFNQAAAPAILQFRAPTEEEVGAGAASVGIHHSQPHPHEVHEAYWNEGWNYHLITVVRHPAGGRMLIDAASSRYTLADADIRPFGVTAIHIDANFTWMPGPGGAAVSKNDQHRGHLAYWPMPPGAAAASSWKTDPGWESPLVLSLVDGLVAHLLERDEVQASS